MLKFRFQRVVFLLCTLVIVYSGDTSEIHSDVQELSLLSSGLWLYGAGGLKYNGYGFSDDIYQRSLRKLYGAGEDYFKYIGYGAESIGYMYNGYGTAGYSSKSKGYGTKSKAFKSSPDMIVEAGYPAESHRVTTADGYILELHRIPYGRYGPGAGKPRPPVLLQHGLLCSSADWVIGHPNNSLGFILADAGYDVWLGNFRGNTYSRRHTKLTTEDSDFWKFSWDHLGKYDLPAMFDHILSTSKQDSLFYVGHSLGTTAFWVAMNDNPQYNDKIRAMIGLGPVAGEEHLKSPIKHFAPYVNAWQWVLESIGADEFLPNTELIEWLSSTFCKAEDMTLPICENVVFVIAGYDKKELGDDTMGKILAHTPAGTSSRVIVQFAQGINSKKFQKYDHGTQGNMELYGQKDPPLYHVDKVTPPVALIWSQNDWLADPADVAKILAELPNLITSIRVEDEDFNHLDFLWGANANALIYEPILDIFDEFLDD